MAMITLTGRVLRATDYAAVAGAAVEICAPAELLGELPGAEVIERGQMLTWTRALSGFVGSRWDCWTAHVRKQVGGMTWPRFRDDALIYNPTLAADGNLFRADKTYLLPESRPTVLLAWTRELSGFSGTRWECWEAHVRGQIPGLTWDSFCADALRYNPHLNEDGRRFRAERRYLLPEIDNRPRARLRVLSGADGSFQLQLPLSSAPIELRVDLDDYLPVVQPVMPVADRPVTLLLMPALEQRSGTIQSDDPRYPGLLPRRRAIVDRALAMLGDDRATFAALPAGLRALCYGARFLQDPNHQFHKDIVCADLASICLKDAGCTLWPGSTHLADYYHPERAAGQLRRLEHAHELLPGDLLIFGNESLQARARHVVVYTGRFSGVDRSGQAYRSAEQVDVVEASMVFLRSGRRLGTGISGITLQNCLQHRRGYAWVQLLRLTQLGD